ncbi:MULTISPECIES: hypothetical protein [Gammaproteobacteria]|jgi:imidazole glycerol phosphate synthase subunit HisF|uniref:Uncharacterized protein n=3 Tax=Vibrio TaxID=662 RepID=A0A7Z1MD86_9VIBR|nr:MULTISPECIES: hypothetical protein [Vibrio]KOE87586.1 hypothetical protein ACS86_02890 [Vibrio alginolyticus]HDI3273454.1 hypothetical protein [Vibrio cholerae]HDM8244540.1 hypothetical protein [Vibrio campbellii]EHH1074832.1 hypothetical protein [Vibrio parahaemolyticus]MCS0419752.1 hypothetical protein [Vibrio diabolicus]
MKASPEQVMESLIEAAKDETTATAAIMALLAHVNEYKIPDLIDSLIESNVLKIKESEGKGFDH